jgi:uncharacterized membrane protein
MKDVPVVLLAVGTVALAFVIGGNLFESIICAPGWRGPDGIAIWRQLTKQRPVGVFFLPLAIGSFLCLAASAVLGWNAPASRNSYMLGASGCVFIALVMTGTYLAPRAIRMFVKPAPNQTDADARRMLEEFLRVNKVRVAIALAALVCALLALRQ